MTAPALPTQASAEPAAAPELRIHAAGATCALCVKSDPRVDDALAVGLPPSLIAAEQGLPYHAVICHRKHLIQRGRPCAPSARRFHHEGAGNHGNRNGNRGNYARVSPDLHLQVALVGTTTLEVRVACAARAEERLRLLGASPTEALLLGIATMEKERGSAASYVREKLLGAEATTPCFTAQRDKRVRGTDVQEGGE